MHGCIDAAVWSLIIIHLEEDLPSSSRINLRIPLYRSCNDILLSVDRSKRVEIDRFFVSKNVTIELEYIEFYFAY